MRIMSCGKSKREQGFLSDDDSTVLNVRGIIRYVASGLESASTVRVRLQVRPGNVQYSDAFLEDCLRVFYVVRVEWRRT